MREVLTSKLTVPTLDDHVLARTKLQEKLEKIFHYRLTILTAGAGYGKTTTLVKFLSNQKHKPPVGWYTLGPEDDNVYFFAIYLAAALDALFPGLKQWYCKRLEQEQNFDWKILYFSLMLGMENFSAQAREGYLVLDDLHNVAKTSELWIFLERFLSNIPPGLHVLLLSRSYLDLPAIENLRLKGYVLDFLPTDFLFNYAEIKDFLALMDISSADPQEVAHILQQTEGWIIVIKLLARHWKEQAGDYLKHLSSQDVELNQVFEYLSRDIFSRQTPQMQHFLLVTALVETFDEAFCEEILPDCNARKLLNEVVKTSLFVSRIGENIYRYHSLVKNFLQLQAKSHLPELPALYKRIALFYQKNNNPEFALQFFLAGKQWPEAATILAQVGQHWVHSGRQNIFLNYLSKIPANYRQNPEIYLCLGDVERFACSYKKSVQWYQLAERDFGKQQNQVGQSRSCYGLGEVYLDIIQPSQAQNYLHRAYKLLPRGHAEEKGKLLYLMSENMINNGDSRRAERYFQLWSRVVAFDKADNNNLQARIYLRTGRIDKVIHLLEPHYAQEYLTRTPCSFRESSLILSLCYIYTGNTEKAMQYARDSIIFANKIQAPFTEAIGYVRLGHALLLDYRHNKDICRQTYEKAAAIVEKLGIERGKTELLQGNCLMQALDGHWQEAEQLGKQGLKLTKASQDAWFTAQLYLTLSLGAALCEHYPEATSYAHKALELFIKGRDFLGQAACYWHLSYQYYQTKQPDAFQAAYTQLLAHCRQYNCEFLLQGKSFLADLTGFTTRPFQKYYKALTGKKTAVPAQAVAIPALYIKTLGGFKLLRQGQEVPESQWRRKAAKQLLFMLITKRASPLSRETFMAYLWPATEQKVAIGNFKVVLNQLITILEPERKPRAKSRYLLSRDGALQLLRQADFQLDVDRFEACVEKGWQLAKKDSQQAQALLLEGLQLYEGTYLAGEYPDDESLQERDRLQTLLLKAEENLALLYIGQGDYDAALRQADKIIRIDACWEAAYQIKLLCYGSQHDKANLKRVYKKCSEVLQTELGVEPAAKTQKLYETYK